MPSKVEEARRAVMLVACRYSDPEMQASIDALIAAVREEERERCDTVVSKFNDEMHGINQLSPSAVILRSQIRND
jgi:hypothetical protein